jgi:hypothetical protein
MQPRDFSKKVDPTFKTMSDCKQVDLQPGCIELFSIKTDEFISLSKTEEAKIDLKKKAEAYISKRYGPH